MLVLEIYWLSHLQRCHYQWWKKGFSSKFESIEEATSFLDRSSFKDEVLPWDSWFLNIKYNYSISWKHMIKWIKYQLTELRQKLYMGNNSQGCVAVPDYHWNGRDSVFPLVIWNLNGNWFWWNFLKQRNNGKLVERKEEELIWAS